MRKEVLPTFLLLSSVLLASVCLPLPGADGRIAHLPGVCPFYELTGLPCPGCGLTRAFVCLGHGHWQASLHWHPLGWLVYLVFVLLWGRAAVTLALGRPVAPLMPKTSRRLAFAAAAVLVIADCARIGWLAANHLRF